MATDESCHLAAVKRAQETKQTAAEFRRVLNSVKAQFDISI